MSHRTTHALALGALLMTLAPPARADVISPEASEAQSRFRDSPGAYDRTDQYCRGHGIDEACRIPGTPLQGGGRGTCRREIDDGDQQINLVCTLEPLPQIRRELPEGAWRADQELCTAGTDASYVCEEPEVVADRFCRGRAEGQACSAEVAVGAQRGEHAGVCRLGREYRSPYFRGRRSVSRPVLTCEAATPLPAREWFPLSWWQKLFGG